MSQNSRIHGLALMAMGVLVFAGTNAQLLPAVAFWPALVTCCVGVVVFMKANRVATEQAEAQTRKALNPTIRNETLERFAEQQARTDGKLLQALGERDTRRHAASLAQSAQTSEDEIVLYEVDDSTAVAGGDADFVVTTDVSFPLEVQEQTSIADQLQKLVRLQEQGIISAEEFAVAKAKLLR